MHQLELIFKKSCNINSSNNIYYFACISCNSENVLDNNYNNYNNYKNIQWCHNCQKERYVHLYYKNDSNVK